MSVALRHTVSSMSRVIRVSDANNTEATNTTEGHRCAEGYSEINLRKPGHVKL